MIDGQLTIFSLPPCLTTAWFSRGVVMFQPLTVFGAGAVAVMLVSYTFERRSSWWLLVFALACAASSAYGWASGTWPFGIVEAVWALVALRRWWITLQGVRKASSLSEA
jgi:hypothetical protein